MTNNTPRAKLHENQKVSHPTEEDPFSNAISSDEFMKQIKTIQQSTDQQDIHLRNAAREYIRNLHCA